MADEGIDADGIDLPALQQFQADDGLATVRALQPEPEAQVDDVVQDLRELENVLEAAKQHGVGWHLEVDF